MSFYFALEKGHTLDKHDQRLSIASILLVFRANNVLHLHLIWFAMKRVFSHLYRVKMPNMVDILYLQMEKIEIMHRVYTTQTSVHRYLRLYLVQMMSYAVLIATKIEIVVTKTLKIFPHFI